MNFVADESVDRQIIEKLRHNGHAVLYVTEMAPAISDEEVLKIANDQSAPLITSDKDFGELVFRQGLASQGVILIRLAGLNPELKAKIVVSAVEKHLAELPENFSVITLNKIRIRKL